MKKLKQVLIAMGVAATIALNARAVDAADSVADFYRGRVISIIVPYDPGGGYDVYAQLITHYIGRYIPGNPSIVLRHVPGAGGLMASNQLYNVGPFDGTSVVIFPQGSEAKQGFVVAERKAFLAWRHG